MEKLLFLLDLMKRFPRYGVLSAVWICVAVGLAAIHVHWHDMAKAIRFLLFAGVPK